MKNTNHIKTSIIIPVYNVENYLAKCLDSCINQTLREIEIICVNDESPDNCAQILAEYAKQDNRIIVLNQKNSGQGSARNRGLEIARGKYIQFLDSDDFYELNCCEEMYNLMEKHPDIDVACFDTNIVYDAYEDKKEGDAGYFKMHYVGKNKIKPSMAHQLVDCNCWNKIFRKSFIDRHNLRFPENLHYEDCAFLWFWITRTEYAYFYPKKLTNYLRRKGSFLGEIYEKESQTIFDAFKVNELIYDDLIKNNRFKEYKKTYIRSYLLKFRWLIDCFKKEKWHDRKILIDNAAQFLSQFDISNISLDEYEATEFKHIINKNYYIFGALNSYEIETPEPKYENGINICFSCDKKYIPYLSVAIESIIENSSSKHNYDIIILYDDIYDFQKRFLLSMIKNYPNISIRFFNMKRYIAKYNISDLYTRPDMSLAAYYRLFVGDIFAKYQKLLYLDCDLVATKDIAELFNISIKDYALGACLDTNIANEMFVDETNKKYMTAFREYMRQTFKYYDSKTYFNSGVLLVNIQKFNEIPLTELLELAQKNTKFYHDQNVLNVAFCDDYIQLPTEWNAQSHIKYYPTYRSQLPTQLIELYDTYDDIPGIIHYTSHPKVWRDPFKQWANIWWKYARETPFYEIILKENLLSSSNKITAPKETHIDFAIVNDLVSKPLLKLRYLKCKILSKITFGRKRTHYKEKRMLIKARIKKMNSYFRAN